ncbi:hypothetical protein SEA_ZIMMER_58 [Mycobacterium phage Zimmer]|nr:hypothetical protein SEA_ZIMMER_58 [Mycobacterium phage Zimmer]
MAYYRIDALVKTDDDEETAADNAESLLSFYTAFELKDLSVYEVTHFE